MEYVLQDVKSIKNGMEINAFVKLITGYLMGFVQLAHLILTQLQTEQHANVLLPLLLGIQHLLSAKLAQQIQESKLMILHNASVSKVIKKYLAHVYLFVVLMNKLAKLLDNVIANMDSRDLVTNVLIIAD